MDGRDEQEEKSGYVEPIFVPPKGANVNSPGCSEAEPGVGVNLSFRP
jgi:hypothetical protein